MKITHYDLFAGIGGFSLALDTVFYDSEIKHIFCEWEAFPTAVLKKHWPDGTYYGDIADLVTDSASEGLQDTRNNPKGRCTKFNKTHENKTQGLCILTGGFPCQPFSHAGRRQGTADDRYKWPDMFAVIKNVKPDWVIAENVRGLVTWNEGMVLETVCADLESEGYEVQPLVIPACAIGAPHRRDRVWIVANRSSSTGRVEQSDTSGQTRQSSENAQREMVRPEIRETSTKRYQADSGATPDPRQQLREQRSGEGVEADTSVRTTRPEANQREHQYTWADDWREVAFTTCHDGVDDGLPRWMDGTTISASRHRKERLKACGNAIVPQVAMEIFKAIRVVIHTP